MLPTVADGKLKPLCLAALSLKLSDCLHEKQSLRPSGTQGLQVRRPPQSISFCPCHCLTLLPFNVVWWPQHRERNAVEEEADKSKKLPPKPGCLCRNKCGIERSDIPVLVYCSGGMFNQSKSTGSIFNTAIFCPLYAAEHFFLPFFLGESVRLSNPGTGERVGDTDSKQTSLVSP